MKMKYPDGSVMVTGASKGIGRSIALKFGELGMDIAVCYWKDDTKASETAKVIQTVGGKAIIFKADLRDPTICEDLVSRVEDKLGPVSILINNAGMVPKSSICDTELSLFSECLSTNLLSPFALIQSVAKRLIARHQKGVVINIGSIHGLQSAPGMAAYSVSKAALESLTRIAALELGRLGIRVNCVIPGFVGTERILRLFGRNDMMRKLEERIPTGKLASPDQIADVVLFLCSESAAQINGASIVIDGGLSCQLNIPKGEKKEGVV